MIFLCVVKCHKSQVSTFFVIRIWSMPKESSFVSKASIKYALHFIVYVSGVWKYVNHFSLFNRFTFSLIIVFMVMCAAKCSNMLFFACSCYFFHNTIVGANSSQQLPHNKSLWWWLKRFFIHAKLPWYFFGLFEFVFEIIKE